MSRVVVPIRENIRTLTSKGWESVAGIRIGSLAVHPAIGLQLDDGSPYWSITHVPTGFRLGGTIGFETEGDALTFIRCLDALPVAWADPHCLRKNKKIAAAFTALADLCCGFELEMDPA